ncbi:hypothetical protein [Bartonella sp. CL100XZDX]|uniref:hypothetical protein n=1 Tax=Bartonella sp. CL100XZDX TaxID=3243515 RepID=UPI0035D12F02
MLKFVLRLFLLFLFVIHIQLTRAEEKETDNSSLISPLIANYPLTEDLFLKLEKIEKECENLLPETKNDLITYDSSIHSNIENYTTYISSKPKLMNIFKKNNIKPEDFAAGNLVLKEISALLIFAPEKEYSTEKNTIFLNNLEFVKKHFYKATILLDSCEKLILSN